MRFWDLRKAKCYRKDRIAVSRPDAEARGEFVWRAAEVLAHEHQTCPGLRHRIEEHSADNLAYRVKPVFEFDCDAEVAAAAPERPEEVGVFVLVSAELAPVCGYDFG